MPATSSVTMRCAERRSRLLAGRLLIWPANHGAPTATTATAITIAARFHILAFMRSRTPGARGPAPGARRGRAMRVRLDDGLRQANREPFLNPCRVSHTIARPMPDWFFTSDLHGQTGLYE